MMASELKLGPAEVVMGKIDMTQFSVPVPGSSMA
jgi:hypothetical protein